MTDDARNDRDFADSAEAIVRLGSMLLSAGAGSYRVKRCMDEAALRLGMDRHDAVVNLADITMTVHRGDNFRTICRQVHQVGVDARRIDALESLARHLPERLTPIELEQRLDRVSRQVGARWGTLTSALAAGVGGAMFGLLNQVRPTDAVLVAIAATLGQGVRHQMDRLNLNPYGVAAAATAVAGILYAVLVALLRATPFGAAFTDAGFIAALLFVVPSFPLVAALIDMARLDIVPGIARAVHALGVVVAASMAAWLIAYVARFSPLPDVAPRMTGWAWPVAAGATFVGVCAFALLYNSTGRMVLGTATLALVANLVRLWLLAHGVPVQAASFVGGLLIGLVAALLAGRLGVPQLTLTVPATMIMFPGSSVYRSMYWLNADDLGQAADQGAKALLVVVSIACGLAAARMLTDRAWTRVVPVDSPHAFRDDDDWERSS